MLSSFLSLRWRSWPEEGSLSFLMLAGIFEWDRVLMKTSLTTSSSVVRKLLLMKAEEFSSYFSYLLRDCEQIEVLDLRVLRDLLETVLRTWVRRFALILFVSYDVVRRCNCNVVCDAVVDGLGCSSWLSTSPRSWVAPVPNLDVPLLLTCTNLWLCFSFALVWVQFVIKVRIVELEQDLCS